MLKHEKSTTRLYKLTVFVFACVEYSKNSMAERFYGKHFAFLIHFRITLKLIWNLFLLSFRYIF